MAAVTTAVIVPSARRPGSARRLAGKFLDTAADSAAALILAVDDDDPELPGYRAVRDAHPWIRLREIKDSPHRIGPIINAVAAELLDGEHPPDFIGFMGDDHLPRTRGWVQELTAELRARPGVAYGNDLHQRDALPTACIISAPLADALGYLVPPGMGHLFLDDFWKRLGEHTHLAYRDDVIVEHLHPDAGKAEHDLTYARAGRDSGTWYADDAAYEQYLNAEDADGKTAWDRALARIAHLRPAVR